MNSRGLLRDCEIFGNIRITFVSSTTVLLYLDLRSSEWTTDIQEPEQGRDPDHEVEFRSDLVNLSLVFVIST